MSENILKKLIFLLILLLTVSIYITYVFQNCVIITIRNTIPTRWRHPTTNQLLEGRHLSVVRLVPLKNCTGTLVSDKYRRQDDYLQRRLPTALIIGVKKGGTRALLEFIRLHPDVRAAGNEVHFFDRYYRLGYGWYRNRMPPTLPGQVTIEKTPSYYVTRDVPRRLHHMNPSIRLLVVVRDPVTRAVSDYAQAVSKQRHNDTVLTFERMAFVNVTHQRQKVATSWGPIRLGLYGRYLLRWLRYFPHSQLLFVSGERLVSDPVREIRRVQEFLGLNRVIGPHHFYFNASKGFPCLIKRGGTVVPHCLGKTKGRSHPNVSGAVLNRLRDFYRPFNHDFYHMTGIDFGWD